MPSTATITSYYNFTALTPIRSSEVNTNFSNHRGHVIPIDPNTATAGATRTYDLGSYEYNWRAVHNQYGLFYANTAGSVPTVSTSTSYALYFKNDGNLYKKDSGGTETAFSAASNLSVASTSGGFTLTNSNDVVLCSISSSASTFNLFTAAGNTGKILRFVKTDSSTNAVTIDANSTETIAGDLTTTLVTQYETLDIISDGSNWQILNRAWDYKLNSYTPGSQGFGTPSVYNVFWQRIAPNVIEISGRITVGTPTAVEGRINLPNSWVIDNTTQAITRLTGYWIRNLADTSAVEYVTLGQPNVGYINVGRRTSTDTPLGLSNGNAVSDNGGSISFRALVPISGWPTK